VKLERIPSTVLPQGMLQYSEQTKLPRWSNTVASETAHCRSVSFNRSTDYNSLQVLIHACILAGVQLFTKSGLDTAI